MRQHTDNFKNNISRLGRMLDSQVRFIQGGYTTIIPTDFLNSVSIHYKGDILKSVMQQIDIDTRSSINLELGTIIDYWFGVKVNGNFEYLKYNGYIVYKSEKQEDTNSYKITCFDRMLLTMVDYEDMNITYPISVRDYIFRICMHLGIGFANENTTFTNYNKMIPKELYLDDEGNSLGYTFRDVLDDLAEVTASTICINNIGLLEIKYINETNDIIDESFLKDYNVNFGEKYGPINSIVLSRSAGADSIYEQDNESIQQNGLCELKIEDNQIMNGNDRDTYLADIFTRLNGLEYYINDYVSTGIMYYNLCDRYTVKIGNKMYSCVMLNDEAIITQGLVENIHTDMPTTSETDYSKADKTDRKINQAYLLVNKQEGEIEALVNRTNQLDTSIGNNYQELKEQFNGYAPTSRVVEIERSVQQIQTDTYTKTEINTKLIDGSVQKVQTASATFDESGMTYRKTDSEVETTINEVGVKTKKISNNKTILFAGYVDENNSEFSDYEGQTIVATDNIIVQNYLVIGTHSRLEDYESGTGCFYIG